MLLTGLLQPRPEHVTATASAASLLTAVFEVTAVFDEQQERAAAATAADAGSSFSAVGVTGAVPIQIDWAAALLARLPAVPGGSGAAVAAVAVTALRVKAPAMLLPASLPCRAAPLDDLRSRLTAAAQRLAAAANDTRAIQTSVSVTCEAAPHPPEPPGTLAPPPPDEPAYDAASVGDPIHADWTAAHRRLRRRRGGSRLLLQQAAADTGLGAPAVATADGSAAPAAASSAAASECATAFQAGDAQAVTGLLEGQSLLRVSVRFDATTPRAVPVPLVVASTSSSSSSSISSGSGITLNAVSGLAAVEEVAAALAAWRTAAAFPTSNNASTSAAGSSVLSSPEALAALAGLCVPSAQHLTVLTQALAAYEVPLSAAGRTAYLQTCTWAAGWGPSRTPASVGGSSSSSGMPFLMSRAVAASATAASSQKQAVPLPRPPAGLAAAQGMASSAVIACEVSDVRLTVATDGGSSNGRSIAPLLQPPAALMNTSSPVAILYARWEESVPESVLLPAGNGSSSSNSTAGSGAAPRSAALAERYAGAVEARVQALRVDVPAILLPEQLPCSGAGLERLRALLAASAQRLMIALPASSAFSSSSSAVSGATAVDSSGVNITCITTPLPPSPPAPPPAAPPAAAGTDAIPANLHVLRRRLQGSSQQQDSRRRQMQQGTGASSSVGCVAPAAPAPELLPPGQSLLFVSLRLPPDFGANAAAGSAARSGSAAGEEALEAVSGAAAASAVAEALQGWHNTTTGAPAAAALAVAALCLPSTEQLAVIVEAQVTYRVPLAPVGRNAYYQACNASARAEATAAAAAAATATAAGTSAAAASTGGSSGSSASSAGGSLPAPSPPGLQLQPGSLGSMGSTGSSVLDSVASSTSAASDQSAAATMVSSSDSVAAAAVAAAAAAAVSALAAADSALGMPGVSLCRVVDVWPTVAAGDSADVAGLPIDPGAIWAPFDTAKPLTAAPTPDNAPAAEPADDNAVATVLSSPGVIVAFTFAGIILVLAVVVVTLHAIRRKRRARRTAAYLTDEEKAASAAAASAASALQRALSRRGWRHGKKKPPGGGGAGGGGKAAGAPGLPALQEDWQAEEEWDEEFRQQQQEIFSSLYGGRGAAAGGIIKVPSRSAVAAPPLGAGAGAKGIVIAASEIEPAFDDDPSPRTSGAGAQSVVGTATSAGDNDAACADTTVASPPETHVPAPYGPGADVEVAISAAAATASSAAAVAGTAGAAASSRRLTDSGAGATTVLTASASSTPQQVQLMPVRPPSLRRQAPPPSPATSFRVASAFAPAASASPVFAAGAAVGSGAPAGGSLARTASNGWRSASGDVTLTAPPRPSSSGAGSAPTAGGSSSSGGGGSSSSDAGSAAPSTEAGASRPSTADSAADHPAGPGTRGPSASGTPVKQQQQGQQQHLVLQPSPQPQRLVPSLSSRLLTTRQSWTAESLATAAATAASPASLRSSTGMLTPPQQAAGEQQAAAPPERLFYTYSGSRAKTTNDGGSSNTAAAAAAAAAAASSPFGGSSSPSGRTRMGLHRSMSTAATSSLMASAAHALQRSPSGRAQDGAPGESSMRRSDNGGGVLGSLVATAGRRLGGLARSRSARVRQPTEYYSSVVELGSGAVDRTNPAVPEEDSDLDGSDVEHSAAVGGVTAASHVDTGAGSGAQPQQPQVPAAAAPLPWAGVGPGAGAVMRGVGSSPFGKAAGVGFDRAGDSVGFARGGPAAMLSPTRATSAAPERLN
ncbi:hypothetical protein HXX76_003774 [Chlamydomonas incerta]|uniref:Uncharacterized protein n=1 Tax=Chlamydomonas incerta TaxID=51695 RepID=A0A835W965_CHLIN|nr:hypothetical protein HXX76_003774 [Chlamydomonas incerta]|eukprot:KAG2440921.1 hypothetical protein HXX76_003774 [Chlamydomonas incerta]